VILTKQKVPYDSICNKCEAQKVTDNIVKKIFSGEKNLNWLFLVEIHHQFRHLLK
jgi:hypothetical protein